MVFLKKLKDCGLAVLVMVVIVSLLMVSGVVPFDGGLYWKFMVGAIVFVVGETLFLLGAEGGVMEMGRKIGSNIKRFKNIWFIIGIAFLLGFVLTLAEPDIQFFISQVASVHPALSPTLLLLCLALGIGSFVVIGLFKIIKNIPLKYIMLIAYSILFVLAIFSPNAFLGLSFDASGVTTGTVTVPIILSFAAGLSALKSSSAKEDSFGLVGIASIGPVLVVLLLGLIVGSPANSHIDLTAGAIPFGQLLGDSCLKVFIALAPICFIFLILNFCLFKMPKKALLRLLISVLFSFVGLVMFFVGIYFGFAPMANYVGAALGSFAISQNGIWLIVLVAIVFGFALVFTEPAIGVFVKQVFSVSSGGIKKRTIYLTLGVGMALALVLGVLKIVFEISMWYIILPVMGLAILFSFFSSNLMTGIAFDSGATVVGSMLASFVLPILIGLATVYQVDVLSYAFGVIGLVATMPILCMSALGAIYQIKSKRRMKHADNNDHCEEKLGSKDS